MFFTKYDMKKVFIEYFQNISSFNAVLQAESSRDNL